MTNHSELLARHRAVLPSWLALNYEQPIALVDGEGRHVRDAEGNQYLDMFGGILTTLSGHAVPEVVEAIRAQAGRIVHSSTLYLIEPQIALAEEISSLVPIPDAKVFFTTSGTEANELALLLASTVRRSNQVLAMRNSYHGRSFSTMGVTGNRGWSASSLSPLNVNYLYGGYRYAGPFADLDDAAFVEAAVADLRNTIATTTAGDVACLIAEPIQGVGGFTSPPDGLYGAFKDVCDEHGILFVTDEVQTGWGRTGLHTWGIDAHGVQPDILVFAKGIGNGLSIAGVAARPEIMDSLPANSISTFGGNHLSTAGALANLRYLLDHDLQGNAAKVGERLLRGLREDLADEPHVAEVRGRGLMAALELVDLDGAPSPAIASATVEAARRHGVLIGKAGLVGNVVRIAPPMSITTEEADQGRAAIVAALREATT